MRYALRAVMVTALLAVPAWADEMAAIRAVEKFGGKVRRDDKLPGRPVVEVDLSYTEVTDTGLKELKDLKQLKALFLLKTQVTDAGVQDLKKALPGCNIVH